GAAAVTSHWFPYLAHLRTSGYADGASPAPRPRAARGDDDEEDRHAPRDARRRGSRTRPSRRAAGARPDAHAARALIRGAADALRRPLERDRRTDARRP